MKEAYDNLLQIIVNAEDVAFTGDFGPYRFECPNCGEEVYIAAVDSDQKSPHFRHLHGNNSIECDNYFGLGAHISGERKRKGYREVVDISYVSSKGYFTINVNFSSDKLDYFASNECVLEIRTMPNMNPKEITIDRFHFCSDVPTPVILEKYSDKYYVSISGRENRVYDFIKRDQLIFLKIYGDEDDYLAKRLSSFENHQEEHQVIYTNTRYLAISLNPNKINNLKEILKDDVIKDIEIVTMGMFFYGLEINIKENTNVKYNKLHEMGYKLENNETLTILWPPFAIKEEKNIVQTETVYIKSSFEVCQYHGNNIKTEDIEKIGRMITKIKVGEKGVRFALKNTDLQVIKSDIITELITLDIDEKRTCKYTTNEEYNCVLFDCEGNKCLTPNETIFMSSDRVVCHYKNNIIVERILPKDQNKLTKEEIVKNANKYYKRHVSDVTVTQPISRFGKDYLEEHSDLINVAVLKLIKEGIV